MKRKDVDEFSRQFSGFSLSSPATKIRRLDAALPPIIEEEEPPETAVSGPQSPTIAGNRCFFGNQERAIVLFVNPFLHPSPLSISVDSAILSGFKSEIICENRHDGRLKFGENDEEMETENKNLAVVPWVPRLQVHVPHQEETPQLREVGEETMDIEDDNLSSQQAYGYGGLEGADPIHHWHQQHCMFHQLSQEQASSPITWFR